jgi:hypothetical protein
MRQQKLHHKAVFDKNSWKLKKRIRYAVKNFGIFENMSLINAVKAILMACFSYGMVISYSANRASILVQNYWPYLPKNFWEI